MCGSNARRRRRYKDNAVTSMKIAAIPPPTLPSTTPAFQLCPLICVGVAVFEDLMAEIETEEPEGLRIVPGPRSRLGE